MKHFFTAEYAIWNHLIAVLSLLLNNSLGLFKEGHPRLFVGSYG